MASKLPATRRKKKKMPDKQIFRRVAAFIPESHLYAQLQEFELRVDATLARKKLDIQEALCSPTRFMQRTLRLYIFNTHENQPRASSSSSGGPSPSSSPEPSWSLKIMGRILENDQLPSSTGPSVGTGAIPPPPKAPPFANFHSLVRKVTLHLDPTVHPGNHTVAWEGVRSLMQAQGLEVRRQGSTEFVARVIVDLNHVPEKYQLSPLLAQILAVEAETRPRVIASLWHYIKANKLQDPADPTSFKCDPPLLQLFGDPTVKFASVGSRISRHLSVIAPIQLEHKISLSGPSPSIQHCYDISVDIPCTLEKEMSDFLASKERGREIDACDAAISDAIADINERRRKRSFLLSFCSNPTDFIRSLVAEQSQDLRVALGEQPSVSSGGERRSDIYSQPWVDDAIVKYLSRKVATGADGLNKEMGS